MTEFEQQLITQFQLGKISKEEFLSKFPEDITRDKKFILSEIETALRNKDEENLEYGIALIWISGNYFQYVDTLNKLLLVPFHKSHQAIVQALQDIKSPSSIQFIRKALETNFDYLEYTGSESDAIAKWFSWALFSIGTKEAIELIREYSNSTNDGIKKEMLYRLSKLVER